MRFTSYRLYIGSTSASHRHRRRHVYSPGTDESFSPLGAGRLVTAMLPPQNSYGLYSDGLYSDGLYSDGLYSSGLYSYGLYSYGLNSYDLYSYGIYGLDDW